ncbi:MAG: polyprenyl synthetase family protein [Caldilineaceae bacterium]|nr:polyprenyl synthetase family protein [Caldilineaceae bacterium]
MSVKAAIDIGKVLQPVQADLARVEAKMKSVETSLFAPLAVAFVDLIGSGGKRLRPALALMAANAGRVDPAAALDGSVIALAASVEMLHTATLVHDDVIDGALLRRGAPTLNAIWNRGATVLAGNFMFARAALFAAETGNMRVIRIFSDTLETIVNGELRQLLARHNFHQVKDDYYQRIYAKTASLFCAATEAGAVLAGLPEPQIQHLRSFGYSLGMAFQIVDDILDFTGDEATLGKPAGSDLAQGTLTLPFFYFLQSLPAPEQLVAQMDAAVAEADTGDEQPWQDLVPHLVRQVRAGPAIDAARQEATAFLTQARTDLAALPDTRFRFAMLELCDFVVQRTY